MTGWALVLGGGPVFVFRRRGKVQRVPLTADGAGRVHELPFFRRLDLPSASERVACVFGPRVAERRGP